MKTTTTGFDPQNLLRLVQVLLMHLEDTLSASDEVTEDTRSDQLRTRIQNYRDQVARLRSALSKHRDAERRKRELQRDNDRRNPKKGADRKADG